MSIRSEQITNRRAIIDRRALVSALEEIEPTGDTAMRNALVRVLKPALEAGRAEIAARLDAHPTAGRDIASSYAFLTDQVLRLAYDFTTQRMYHLNNPTAAERIVLVAVGGYGRGEMAPFSDVDIAFITPWKQTGWSEQVIESILYTLWDLGMKVGHSIRSLDDMVRMAKSDLTIRTALLEARYVWGDTALYDEAVARFQTEVVAGTARVFITDKLAERDARHKRMGDSRYVVEPNLKEGKGGLRDLHALFWIGKYMHRVDDVSELVERGLLTRQELRQFQKAENFFWAVRCHLHLIARRPEERLTFDVQREIAERMRYVERPGRSPVERFMQHYFLTAKQVGDLTGLFLANLDESEGQKKRFFSLAGFRRAPRNLSGFVLDRGRLSLCRVTAGLPKTRSG
jgi:[protein-PII] uridylyltransferase